MSHHNSKPLLVRVLVGHESKMLEKKNSDGHTHSWTLFIRSCNKHVPFIDNEFVQKVKFNLHASFNNPTRVVKEPPFEVCETGYASFIPTISIYFPNNRVFKFPYDMNLTMEKKGYHEQEMIFEVKDYDKTFADLTKKYCGEKKKSKRPSAHEEGSTASKKSRKKDREPNDDDKHKDEEVRKNKLFEKNDKTKDRNHFADNRVKPRSTTNEEDKVSSKISGDQLIRLSKKLNDVEDAATVYRISEVLLSLPSSVLSVANRSLRFDLEQAPADTLSNLANILHDF